MSFEKTPTSPTPLISRRKAFAGIASGGLLLSGATRWQHQNDHNTESALRAPNEESGIIYPRKDKWKIDQLHPRSKEIWAHYANVPLFYEDTFVLFGADLNKKGIPVFHTDKATTSILKAQSATQCVSGIIESEEEKQVTLESLIRAKRSALKWIRETPRPIVFIVSAHGIPNPKGLIEEISLGEFDDPVHRQLSVRLTTVELVQHLDERYDNMPERLVDQETPDKIAIITCGAGNIAQDIVYLRGKTQGRKEPTRSRQTFKPSTPFIFSAGTGGQITYANQMLIEMARCKTVGELRPYTKSIGTENQHSDPMFFVPEPTTGETVVIG